MNSLFAEHDCLYAEIISAYERLRAEDNDELRRDIAMKTARLNEVRKPLLTKINDTLHIFGAIDTFALLVINNPSASEWLEFNREFIIGHIAAGTLYDKSVAGSLELRMTLDSDIVLTISGSTMRVHRGDKLIIPDRPAKITADLIAECRSV